MLAKIECSSIEKVCLYYEVMTGRRDFKFAYRLIKGLPEDELIDTNHRGEYYHWMRSKRVSTYISFVNEIMKNNEVRLRSELQKLMKKEMELERGDISNIEGATNFRNREETLSWLNRQINLCTDEKLRSDYLKMITDLQRFKEQDNKDKVQDIQRFYTPILCRECNLYLSKSRDLAFDVDDVEEL